MPQVMSLANLRIRPLSKAILSSYKSAFIVFPSTSYSVSDVCEMVTSVIRQIGYSGLVQAPMIATMFLWGPISLEEIKLKFQRNLLGFFHLLQQADNAVLLLRLQFQLFDQTRVIFPRSFKDSSKRI